jgi:protein tyrosine/serine phosphatase
MGSLWAKLSPKWQERLRPTTRYLDMLLVDHGFIRAVYMNLHPVTDSGKMWRSAQPSPRAIRKLAKRGIKTIINLRGARDCGSYHLEEEACRANGITLVNFPVSSRDTPKVEWLTGARDMFREIEYPALLHCKSGADRAGLMAVLYAFVEEGRPLEEAMGQLSLRYGHVKQAKTGLIDWFFTNYQKRNAESPIEFYDWVESEYDRKAMKEEFMAKGWASILVDDILQRE